MFYKYSLFRFSKLSFLIFLTILIACQSDNSGAKDQYLADHESPRYKWGYIDKKGDLAIKAKYDDNRDFSNGLAAVNYKAKWGYIDKSGKKKIDFLYKEAGPFGENGNSVVKNYDNTWSIIDESGVAKLTYECDRLFFSEQAPYRFQKASIFGFLDENGSLLTRENFYKAYDFEDGLALVRSDRFYLMNQTGELKELNFDKVSPIKSGKYKYKQAGKYGFLDQEGKVIIKAEYDYASNFNNSKAYVIRGSKSYIMHESGQLNQINLENISFHSPGYLVQQTPDGQLLYDFDLKLVSEKAYDSYFRPSDGMTAVMKGDMWSFIDENGQLISPFAYPLVWDYQEDLGRYIEPRKGIGFMDKKGNIAIEPYFIEVKDFNEGLARVQMYR